MLTRTEAFRSTPAAVGGYTANPVNFPGSPMYLSRATALDGVAVGKEGATSFWLKPTTAANQELLVAAGSQIVVRHLLSHKILFFATGGSASVDLTTDSALTINQWNHVILGWNVADQTQASLKGYINRTATTFTVNNYVDAALNYDRSAWGVGSDTVGSTRFLTADVADFYFYMTYVDPATALDDFCTTGGLPGDPADIIAAHGTPILGFTGPTSTWQDNASGSGGVFVENGTLGDGTGPVALP